MTRTSTALALVVAALCIAVSAPGAQERPAKNPLEGREAAIQAGMGLYRSRCADCHGIDASGVRAPDLRQVWASGRTDSGLFQTLRNGVPGTEMPPVQRASDDDLWKILAYLRTLAAPVPTDVPAGNAENGERVFRAQCAGCHRAAGRGGRLGPDLSRIGVSRSRAVVIRRIRGAVEDFTAGFEPVTVTTKNGEAVQGVKKNEDLFSVQVMDSRERIQGYLKSDVREVADGTQSAMPVFGPDRLSESDLTDLLSYLSTLKGFDPSVGK
jgi:putative heme-binding domain-containing protein